MLTQHVKSYSHKHNTSCADTFFQSYKHWWSFLGLSAGSNGWAVRKPMFQRLAPWGRGQRWSSKHWFSQCSTTWPSWQPEKTSSYTHMVRYKYVPVWS